MRHLICAEGRHYLLFSITCSSVSKPFCRCQMRFGIEFKCTTKSQKTDCAASEWYFIVTGATNEVFLCSSPAGIFGTEQWGVCTVHGELLRLLHPRHQKPPHLHAVLNPQRAQDRQLPQPSGKRRTCSHKLVAHVEHFCDQSLVDTKSSSPVSSVKSRICSSYLLSLLVCSDVMFVSCTCGACLPRLAFISFSYCSCWRDP